MATSRLKQQFLPKMFLPYWWVWIFNYLFITVVIQCMLKLSSANHVSLFPSFLPLSPVLLPTSPSTDGGASGCKGTGCHFGLGFRFAPGSPFGRGNSEGRTLSPKRPVAYLCYSYAESWSRWFVYSFDRDFGLRAWMIFFRKNLVFGY